MYLATYNQIKVLSGRPINIDLFRSMVNGRAFFSGRIRTPAALLHEMCHSRKKIYRWSPLSYSGMPSHDDYLLRPLTQSGEPLSVYDRWARYTLAEYTFFQLQNVIGPRFILQAKIKNRLFRKYFLQKINLKLVKFQLQGWLSTMGRKNSKPHIVLSIKYRAFSSVNNTLVW